MRKRKYKYNGLYYERKANNLCVSCGSPAEPKGNGKYYIRCEACRNHDIKELMNDPDYLPNKPSLCWSCENAVPATIGGYHAKGIEDYIQGCSWSISQEPVPGWQAKRTVISTQSPYMSRSYLVISCPKYKQGKVRSKK